LGDKLIKKLEISRRSMVTGTTIIDIRDPKNVLTREESEYPQNLPQIDTSPPTLYFRGELLPRDRMALGGLLGRGR
jgi:predicted Rossmann fold nucleotide-binding protein DprA/Smf involved in DNA uptake